MLVKQGFEIWRVPSDMCKKDQRYRTLAVAVPRCGTSSCLGGDQGLHLYSEDSKKSLGLTHSFDSFRFCRSVFIRIMKLNKIVWCVSCPHNLAVCAVVGLQRLLTEGVVRGSAVLVLGSYSCENGAEDRVRRRRPRHVAGRRRQLRLQRGGGLRTRRADSLCESPCVGST